MPGASGETLPRVERAKAIVQKHVPQVGELGLLDIMHELNWFDHTNYDEKGILQLSGLSDLQLIGLAACLIAYSEGVR
jgi:hypothetical protein